MSDKERLHPSEKMNIQSEYYLESLINDAYKGKGFQKMNELFEDSVICPPQQHGKMLLNEMDRLINKELDRNEFEHVCLLLKCVQHFCKSKCQQGWSLIEQGLVSKMVLWFERALEFLKICKDKKSVILALVEDFFATIVDICKCGSEEGIKALQDSFLLTLGYVIMEKWPGVCIRLEALKTLNCIIDNVPRDDRKKFCSSEELCELMQSMARKLFEVGDYDVQVAMTEVLCRMATKKTRDNFATRWFEDGCIAKAFQDINEKDFETDSRKFLNYLNSRFQDKWVYTFPCHHIYTDVEELVQPQDEKLEHFWIDFNVVSQCVSFYVQNKESNLWDSVRLYKDMLIGYGLQAADGLQILNIYLKSPLTVSLMGIKHFKIFFENILDIYTGIVKTYGRELQIISSVQNDYLTSTPVATSTVKTLSAAPQQRIINQSNISKSADTSDIVHFIEGYHSAAKLILSSPEKVTDVNDSQDIFEDSCEASIPTTGESTSAFSLIDTTRVVSSTEQNGIPELSTKVFTPSTRKTKRLSPDKLLTSSSRETKDQSPDKLLTSTRETIVQSPKKLISTEETKVQLPNKLLTASAREMKGPSPNKPASQKSEFDFADSPESVPHIKVSIAEEILFSMVPASNRHSGDTPRRTRSQDSKKKVVNYREFDSIDSDDAVSIVQSEENWSVESKKRFLTPRAVYSRKKQKSKSKLRVLPLSSESSSDEEMEAKKSADRLNKETNNECGKAESLAFSDLPGVSGLLTPRDSAKQRSTAALPKESHSSGKAEDFKRKRKPSSDEDHGDITFQPRKLFSSCERTQEMSEEDSHSPFGSLTGDLKNKIMSRYKRMGARTQNVLSMLQLEVSNLIDKIQQVNFRKLTHVNKIIEQEVSKFETETQALKDIEKETLEFLEAETMTINAFCANQRQRIEEIDSALNGTVHIRSEKEDQITDV
ncbi:synaptonemal complex protein 2-like isoform X3 [Pseudophryne corroboree]|uniref:synaptonemal complex protein 2-like isoform X3 n=1 Tax=Pseudophryne corroboree TaxID=495146 RepID=UPI0030812431